MGAVESTEVVPNKSHITSISKEDEHWSWSSVSYMLVDANAAYHTGVTGHYFYLGELQHDLAMLPKVVELKDLGDVLVFAVSATGPKPSRGSCPSTARDDGKSSCSQMTCAYLSFALYTLW